MAVSLFRVNRECGPSTESQHDEDSQTERASGQDALQADDGVPEAVVRTPRSMECPGPAGSDRQPCSGDACLVA